MKFIDEALITVTAGHGGKGCVSFRREKFVQLGGPNGGNGGRGGHVIFQSDEGMSTLIDFQYLRHFEAERGEHGMGSMKDGKDGQDIIIKVPVGTLIYNNDTGELLKDFKEGEEHFLAVKGGLGGRGNTFFKSSINQAPDHAQPGLPGEEKNLRLELKLLADVGLIGFPNAGKSTLLSVTTHAKPKIADYPFTTLTPHLGVVMGYHPFTMADIPGLIEGAHEGVGLGDRFLKHIERTGIFVHLISLSPDEVLPVEKRYEMIRKELLHFNPEFEKKNEVIALTKKDLISNEDELKKMVEPFKKMGRKFFVISAVTRAGLDEFLDYLRETLGDKQDQ